MITAECCHFIGWKVNNVKKSRQYEIVVENLCLDTPPAEMEPHNKSFRVVFLTIWQTEYELIFSQIYRAF